MKIKKKTFPSNFENDKMEIKWNDFFPKFKIGLPEGAS
jgi:hypothetical protein